MRRPLNTLRSVQSVCVEEAAARLNADLAADEMRRILRHAEPNRHGRVAGLVARHVHESETHEVHLRQAARGRARAPRRRYHRPAGDRQLARVVMRRGRPVALHFDRSHLRSDIGLACTVTSAVFAAVSTATIVRAWANGYPWALNQRQVLSARPCPLILPEPVGLLALALDEGSPSRLAHPAECRAIPSRPRSRENQS